MKQDVNYILHHKNVNLKMVELKLTSSDVSLYNALFLIWNECGFDTELSINRNDVMKISKIGSANTYTKSLKSLERLKLIKYNPSYNPLVGSKVMIYRFDKGSDNGSDNGTGNGSVKSSSKGIDNGCDNGCATLYKLLNKETIKLLNSKTYSDQINKNLKKWLGLDLKKIKEVEIYPTGDDFWENYDKRVGDEVKSKKLFSKLNLKTRIFIIEQHIPQYKKNQPEKQFRKNPLGYLEEKKYNDEIIKYQNENHTKTDQQGASDAFRKKTAERLGYVQS
jgi:hypothetical protein